MLGIEYLTEALANFCSRYRDSNTDPYTVDEMDGLAADIIDGVLIPPAPFTPSSMFDSYNDELFKNYRYIILEALVKDYHVPPREGELFIHDIVQKTEQLFLEYNIDKTKVAYWRHFRDVVFLLIYR